MNLSRKIEEILILIKKGKFDSAVDSERCYFRLLTLIDHLKRAVEDKQEFTFLGEKVTKNSTYNQFESNDKIVDIMNELVENFSNGNFLLGRILNFKGKPFDLFTLVTYDVIVLGILGIMGESDELEKVELSELLEPLNKIIIKENKKG